MNRGDVVRMVSHQTGMSLTETERIVSAVFESIELSLACGENVTIIRFGRFYPQARGAANRPHPGTGERREVPKSTTVGFMPARTLRGRMNR